MSFSRHQLQFDRERHDIGLRSNSIIRSARKAQGWTVAEPALVVKKDAVRGKSLNRLYCALSHAGGHEPQLSTAP
jgi:hypothetical protein